MTVLQQGDKNRPKFALITGASSGIGYALTKEFSKRGYKVIACSPQEVIHLQEPLVKEFGAISVACDITNIDDLKRLKEFVFAHTSGYLDVLYNNAGIAIGGPAAEIDEVKLNRIFQVNVIGHINVTKQLSPFVINAKGSIVYTSSVAARVPLAWTSAYSATKAAIDAYAQTLHGEMAPFGVKVHSVITGGVDTDISGNPSIQEIEEELGDSKFKVDGIVECFVATREMSHDSKYSPDKYAKDMVGKVCKKSSKFNLYGGYRGYFLHFISRYFPLWLVEFVIQSFFKQRKVFKNVKKLAQAKNVKS
ncbi:hypothetical protein KGF56_001023 [Candida oxycetoniae]|uniref:NADPH-dependent 1-acyldihydroxyacetone phosphate reductase n=1 Tax=Candida oxycetoniae TaxID=497107 RepID=A0AAI9T0W2_9ASCO|nr:uncharacterized protein KGF56_001023 [Candida oxycetoniae]KAI3406181.2 hypothetical protein KGF56_001023 [Candida oxycetoniae]